MYSFEIDALLNSENGRVVVGGGQHWPSYSVSASKTYSHISCMYMYLVLQTAHVFHIFSGRN